MRWYALTYALPTIWLQAPVLLLSALGLGGPMVVTFVLHRTLVNFGRNFVVMLSTAVGVELTPHVHSGNTAMIERGITLVGRSVAAMGGVMAAGLLTFGASIVQLWTGKSDLFDMATLFWLVLPAIVVAPAIPLLYLAHLADIPKQQAIAQVTQTTVAIALAGPFAASFGAAGVAFAMAAGEIREHRPGAADLVDKATWHRLLATCASMHAHRFRGSRLGWSRGKSARLRDRNTGLGEIGRLSRHMGRRNALADRVSAIAGRPT